VGEVHKKVAEDARMSYGLKPRCKSGEEEKKLAFFFSRQKTYLTD